MTEFEKKIIELKERIINCENLSELNKISSEIFSKNGIINTEFKKLGSLSEDQKKVRASSLNNEKQKISEAINGRFKELEKIAILAGLKRTNWNMSTTAQQLGISRMTLYRKLDQHNIDKIRRCGADFFIVGSALFSAPDYQNRVTELTRQVG